MKQNMKGGAFLAVSGLGVGLFFVYALAYCLYVALRAGLGHFAGLLGSAAFQQAFVNTCLLMLAFVAGVILLSLVIVYLLDDTPGPCIS